MNIKQDFIPTQNRNRPGNPMHPTYITLHNTANPANGANAEMHAKYLNNGAGGQPKSWHYTCDDTQIVQHLPTDEIGWHAGDGSGPGNSKSIGIEICENEDGDYEKAEENAVWLIRKLMKEHNIPLKNVVPHKHWTGKHCPHKILSRWDEFVEKIEMRMPLTKEDAEKIIRFLSAGWFVVEDNAAGKVEFNRLANEIRKAAGMEVE